MLKTKNMKIKFSKARIEEYERHRDNERKERRYDQFMKRHGNGLCCIFLLCFPCIYCSKEYENNQVSPD